MEKVLPYLIIIGVKQLPLLLQPWPQHLSQFGVLDLLVDVHTLLPDELQGDSVPLDLDVLGH
jgi:hypothetical protein